MGRQGWMWGLPAAAVALVACTFVTFASAGGARPVDRSSHLLVVPDTPAAQAALAAAAARVVAGYESFTLVEASGDDVEDLTRAGAALRDDMREVRIGAETSDPSVDRPTLLDKSGAAQRTAGTGGRRLAVVQYVGPIKDAWIAAVRKSGVQVVTYMAQNGQLVTGDAGAIARLAKLQSELNFVRAITPYTAADKQAPGLRRTGRAAVVVSTVAGEAGADARAAVRKISARRRDDLTVANFTQQHVSLDASALGGLAELGGVVALEPAVEPELLDERAATIVSGALNGSFQPVLGSGYRSFLTSKGFSTDSPVVVDITDEGVDKGVVPVPAGSHQDFYRNGWPANASRILYAQEATAGDADARDCGGHGTNVASIATGYNAHTGGTDEDAANFNYGLGIAPYAKLGATKIFNCAGTFDVTTSLTALHSAAYTSSARISNNSWGAAVGGAYTSTSQEFDALVRDAQPAVGGNQQFTEVVSAGNSGSAGNSIGAPATAKNVITVGASENVRPIGFTDGCGVSDAEANSARDIIDFSSRGPTDDGRIKPDVVAPGTHVTGAQPQTAEDFNGSGTCNPQFPAGSTRYTLVSGTSQAAPEVTGFAALLREWYRGAHGGGTTYPTPAMTKALMVNTASDLAGGNDGAGGTNAAIPTQIQGWGRINLGRVLDDTVRQVVDQTKVLAASGAVNTTYHNHSRSTRPIKVTLAWSDAVGPTTGNSFVNDLDLEVTAGGQTYRGNMLSNGVSVPGGDWDTRNNVENVFLPAGVTGSVKVRVVGRTIAGDGLPGNADTTDQDYALFLSNVGPPLASHAVITAGARTLTRGGDGDAYFEPGEPFTVRQSLRNIGNVSIGGPTGTLTATGATVTTGTSSWPTLTPNVSEINSPAFGATVTASCGTQIALSLTAPTGVGRITLPFEVQTGRPATTAVTRTSADVPKAIPDNNATGVTSNLPAGTTGVTVSDLDVTIGQITHTWVADLVIDITSPEGTTVRLANFNGGSGDNFSGTVFDDEAATSITTVTSADAPFTGSYRPFQPLSAFDGETITGTWKLKVADVAPDDVGTLSSWNTKTKGYTC